MELQFINTNNRIVASSFGRFTAKTNVTSDITDAVATKQISSFTGANPPPANASWRCPVR